MVFVDGCENPKSVTLLLRLSSKSTLDEFHRSILDALSVLKDFTHQKPAIVAGGGSTEAITADSTEEKQMSFAAANKLWFENLLLHLTNT